MQALSLSYSSCPNDTYIFDALIHGRINTHGIRFDVTIADVETLNQAAAHGLYDITKLSFAAMGALPDQYTILNSGSALGRGCGPLIITSSQSIPASADSLTAAVPGMGTTACLLFQMYMAERHPQLEIQLDPMPFDRIMPAVSSGKADIGIIIHEGRFVYESAGFNLIQDLGRWWETSTGLPIPLGCIAIKRSLDPDLSCRIDKLIRDSISFARQYPDAGQNYIKAHAQELSEEVIQQHIDLYVNDFSLDLGNEGRQAIRTFFNKSAETRLIPVSEQASWFLEDCP